jgi:hypothetical protein
MSTKSETPQRERQRLSKNTPVLHVTQVTSSRTLWLQKPEPNIFIKRVALRHFDSTVVNELKHK